MSTTINIEEACGSAWDVEWTQHKAYFACVSKMVQYNMNHLSVGAVLVGITALIILFSVWQGIRDALQPPSKPKPSKPSKPKPQPKIPPPPPIDIFNPLGNKPGPKPLVKEEVSK